MNNLITKNFTKSSLLLLLFVFQLIISMILAHDDEFSSPAGEILLQPVVDGPTEYRAKEEVAKATAAAGVGGSRRKLAAAQHTCEQCKCCVACPYTPCCYVADCHFQNCPFVLESCHCNSCGS